MSRPNSVIIPLAVLAALAAPATAQQQSGGTLIYNAPLRVCADPDDLPYSNKAGDGFENKLAEMLAQSLDTTVAYTWYPQRPGFLRQTLDATECDVVIGTPDMDGIEATRSYYRSSYVFVSRADRNLTFSSINAPELKTLKIGVNLVGADGAGTPPAVALGQQGITDKVVGFPVYGDGSDSQHEADPIEAVARGELDVAAVWGPVGGYYAKHSGVPMRVTPITDTEGYLPQIFQYPIAMGVRPGDDDLKDRLDAFISSHHDAIKTLLANYGVPLL